MDLPERRSAMSLDVLGAVDGSIDKLKAVIPPGMQVRYVEAIGLGPARRLRRHIARLADNGITVSEIHGRTGADGKHSLLDEVRLRGMHMALVSTPKLAAEFASQEILVHVPEARRPHVLAALRQAKPPYVFVENHYAGEAGLQEAADIVQSLRKTGVAAGVMFDGVHHIGVENLRSPRNFSQAWDKMLDAMVIHRDVITGLHVAVGTMPDDSYPIARMSDSMLRDIAVTMPETVRTVTVENQQQGRLMFLPQWDVASVRRRNGVVFDRLQKAGIVDFS